VAVHIRFHDVDVGAHRISFRYATKVHELEAPRLAHGSY
jgi:hypothetical protein